MTAPDEDRAPAGGQSATTALPQSMEAVAQRGPKSFGTSPVGDPSPFMALMRFSSHLRTIFGRGEHGSSHRRSTHRICGWFVQQPPCVAIPVASPELIYIYARSSTSRSGGAGEYRARRRPCQSAGSQRPLAAEAPLSRTIRGDDRPVRSGRRPRSLRAVLHCHRPSRAVDPCWLAAESAHHPHGPREASQSWPALSHRGTSASHAGRRVQCRTTRRSGTSARAAPPCFAQSRTLPRSSWPAKQTRPECCNHA
jgi:hypothetical protein